MSGCPLEDYLKKYQNPVEADPMMKVQNELDEAYSVMQDNLGLIKLILHFHHWIGFNRILIFFQIIVQGTPTHFFALWPKMSWNLKFKKNHFMSMSLQWN